MPAMDSGIFEGECQQDDKPGSEGLNLRGDRGGCAVVMSCGTTTTITS